MNFHVEHNKGIAGLNVKAVEEYDNVEAASALAAIHYVANVPDGWTELTKQTLFGETAQVSNPTVANRPGAYCDIFCCSNGGGEPLGLMLCSCGGKGKHELSTT